MKIPTLVAIVLCSVVAGCQSQDTYHFRAYRQAYNHCMDSASAGKATMGYSTMKWAAPICAEQAKNYAKHFPKDPILSTPQ